MVFSDVLSRTRTHVCMRLRGEFSFALCCVVLGVLAGDRNRACSSAVRTAYRTACSIHVTDSDTSKRLLTFDLRGPKSAAVYAAIIIGAMLVVFAAWILHEVSWHRGYDKGRKVQEKESRDAVVERLVRAMSKENSAEVGGSYPERNLETLALDNCIMFAAWLWHRHYESQNSRTISITRTDPFARSEADLQWERNALEENRAKEAVLAQSYVVPVDPWSELHAALWKLPIGRVLRIEKIGISEIDIKPKSK